MEIEMKNLKQMHNQNELDWIIVELQKMQTFRQHLNSSRLIQNDQESKFSPKIRFMCPLELYIEVSLKK